MQSTKLIQSKAQSAKRASTSITNLVSWIQSVPSISGDLLNARDQKILMEASSILSRINRHCSDVATKAKSEEDRVERELESHSREARKIIDTWPNTTILDKVAFILGSDSASGFLKESDAKYFNYWYQDALRTVPSQAAWIAYSRKCSVSHVLDGAYQRLQRIKEGTEAKSLANQWERKMEGLSEK